MVPNDIRISGLAGHKGVASRLSGACARRIRNADSDLSGGLGTGSHLLQLLEALAQQLHLVVGVRVLRLEVRVLLLQLAQLVRHPVLDARGLCLHRARVGQAQQPLK